MNPNKDLHGDILEAFKSGFSLQGWNTDFHGDLVTTGRAPSSPTSFAPDHPVIEMTSLLPNDEPTNDGPTNDGPTNDGPTNDGPANNEPTDDDPTDDEPMKYEPTNNSLPSNQNGSWLFFLPAEIRLKIWRELLVTTKVYVSFTNCRLLVAQRGSKRKQRATRRVSEFDEKHVEYYGVLGDNDDGEEADVGTYFSPRRCHDDWTEYNIRNMRIPMPVKFRDSYHPRPHLNIFLTCRRARHEVEPIFYSENCFTFCTCNQFHDYNAAREISAAHAAYCFLQDRSPEALKEIKHIELHIMH